VLPVILAAACAVVWGVGDFAGGKASQRADALAVTVVSQILGLPVLVLCLLFVPGEVRGGDLLWGALAGGAGLAGIVLLYRALSGGAMAVVAPVTAITAALVPMAVGLAVDRSPGAPALAGAACALVAIGLVSLGPRSGAGHVERRMIGLALLAGTLLGIFTSLLGQSTPESGLWALVGVRASSIGLGALLMLATGVSFRLPRPVLPAAVVAGSLDIGANALFVAAAARGHLSVVATIASLYPASTVVLALAVDKERLRWLQVVGLALAAAALVLASA
jgi:drug/metabolite transporter (DMT)-like permease